MRVYKCISFAKCFYIRVIGLAPSAKWSVYTMGDIAELKELVAKMAADNAALIAALNANPGAAHVPPAPNAEQLRAAKLAKLSLALRKSGKLKDFKDSQQSNVREWLKRFDQELLQLKKMSGINDALNDRVCW